MLARSGSLPTRGAYAYEVKWDGFRAIVSTEGPLRVRSRRAWNMTEHVHFLEDLPVRAVVDGELVAFDDKGKPDFPSVCEAVLHRHTSIALTFVAFDLLSIEGRDVTREPYSERRRILTQMRLHGPRWRTPEAFEDGAALWHAVCEHELEGVVAKRRFGRYHSGERGWVKVKNRAYWRYELEREGAFKSRTRPRGLPPGGVRSTPDDATLGRSRHGATTARRRRSR
jgi:bifunctional non-homologous end joining protein LigD